MCSRNEPNRVFQNEPPPSGDNTLEISGIPILSRLVSGHTPQTKALIHIYRIRPYTLSEAET